MVARKRVDAADPAGMPPGALRVTVGQAAGALVCSTKTVRRLVAEGVLLNLSEKAGKRVYLLPEQVRVYAEKGEQAARMFGRVWLIRQRRKGK